METREQIWVKTQTDIGQNKRRVKRWSKERLTLWGTMLLLAVITGCTFVTMDYGDTNTAVALGQFCRDLARVLLQPALSGRFSFHSLIEALWVSLALSLLTTLLGTLLAFFCSLLAARNLSSKPLSQAIRMVMSFIRAVPTILWVLVFSVILGLGATAAVVGMIFHSIAYLTKAFSERIEEMDGGILEALRASGAGYWQIVFQGVLPTCLTALLSWTFIRFEINFTNAIAVGAAAGAGGLGFQLAMASGFYFDLHEIGVIVYLIFIVAVVLELISVNLRSRFLIKQ